MNLERTENSLSACVANFYCFRRHNIAKRVLILSIQPDQFVKYIQFKSYCFYLLFCIVFFSIEVFNNISNLDWNTLRNNFSRHVWPHKSCNIVWES